MSKTKEVCFICNQSGNYDHECDESNESNMTCMAEGYVHWGDCYDKANIN